MAKKKAVKKTVTKKKASPKKRGVNKSQAVRDYLDVNQGAKPKDVVAALAKKGIRVSPQQVSTIKSKMASGTGTPKKQRKAIGQTGSTKRDEVSLSLLVEAKRFAGKVGGAEDALRLLDALKKLEG